jgi:hypothetical protein
MEDLGTLAAHDHFPIRDRLTVGNGAWKWADPREQLTVVFIAQTPGPIRLTPKSDHALVLRELAQRSMRFSELPEKFEACFSSRRRAPARVGRSRGAKRQRGDI